MKFLNLLPLKNDFNRSKTFGVFPILAKMTVYHNIPRPGSSIRGAMNWHKDDFGYKSLDLFLNITDIDENSGPLYALRKKERLGVFSRSFNEIQNAKSGEKENFNRQI